MITSLFRTMGIALVGGALFQLLHVPLAWMLGPMVAVMAANTFFKWKLTWPLAVRDMGLIILGYMMGLSFTLETGIQIVKQLPAMLFATSAIVLFSMLMGYVFCRLTGIGFSTGIIGTIPGGLSQMTVLGEEIKNADLTVVMFMQTIRVICVVFIIPFLAVHGFQHPALNVGTNVTNTTAGILAPLNFWSWHMLAIAAVLLLTALASVRLKLPTPYLIGPMLASAVFVVSGLDVPHPPSLIIMLAQLMIGAHMGLSFQLGRLSKWKLLLPYTLVINAAVIGFSFAISYVLTLWQPISMLTAFLSSAPGGMTEMGVMAATVNADLSVIVAYQMFRVLFILFTVPPLLIWWFQRWGGQIVPGEMEDRREKGV